MSLRDNLTAPGRRGTQCAISRLAQTHPDIRAELDELYKERQAHGTPTYAAMATALRSEGHDISEATVSRHGRLHCKCRTVIL